MIIGPKYKIARRLGAGIFEKTQTQKFALRQARKTNTGGRRGGPKSDFGIQLLEKQKARLSYALTERQFSKYVNNAIVKKGDNREMLYVMLESRLDNAVLKSGFAMTRMAARQMVSHGHIYVNDKRVTVPSYNLKIGDGISIRPASANKMIFSDYSERMAKFQSPSWIAVDVSKKTAKIQGQPKLVPEELLFDISQVLEFYKR